MGASSGRSPFLEPEGGFRPQTEALGGVAVVVGVEGGGFQENVGGVGADFGVGPADDAAQADGVFGVGDDQVFRGQAAVDAVQGLQALGRGGRGGTITVLSLTF